MNIDAQIPNKVAWIVDISKSWEELFYPSLVKKILKSQSYFEELVEIRTAETDLAALEKEFFPLYQKQIVNQANYHLDFQAVKQKLDEALAQGRVYKLFGVYEKQTGSFLGGTLFSIKDDRASTAIRVYDREFSKQHKTTTTLDFWAEAAFITYLQESSFKVLRHGADKHPRVKSFGLYMFKMQVGAKPIVSNIANIMLPLDELDIAEELPFLLFSNPDENDYYQEAHVYHAQYLDKEIVSFVTSMMEWSQIKLELHDGII